MNSKINSSTENYKTQSAEFIIPQEKYKKMVYDILGVKKITEEVILSLLAVKGQTIQKVIDICKINSVSDKDFLERSFVGLRTEKDIEDRSLLEYGKGYISNASKLSDQEIIEIVKVDIKNRGKDCIVNWPGGSINYLATQDAVISTRKRRKKVEEQKESLKQNGVQKRNKVLASLSQSDKNELNTEIQKALNLSIKISKGKGVELYLKSGRCKDSKKLTSVAAQKFFYKEYTRLYTEKYPDIKNEFYPPDREIVIIPLSNNGKHVCKVRGEREIINIVVKKINNWKIKLLDYIIDENNKEMTERNRAKVEMILQNIIDEYYQFLRLYEYKGINDLGEKRQFPLDLEVISTEFREIKENNVHTLGNKEFSEKLKLQKIKSITEKSKRDKSTKSKEEALINNIPEFNGFNGVLDCYKDYIESSLEHDNPDLRKNRPERVKILDKYGFTYLKQGSIIKNNTDVIITLQPKKQKSL